MIANLDSKNLGTTLNLKQKTPFGIYESYF